MKKKIVIIGGGVAGLSTGIYGQKNGYETELFEMNSVTGGQCTAWERKGYRFDYCLHWLVGTNRGVFHDIWKETNVINGHTAIIDHEIHSVILDESGNEFIIYSNIARWEKYLIELAPVDTTSIRKMCSHMRKAALYEPADNEKGLRGVYKKIKALARMAPLYPLFVRYGKKNCKQYFDDLKFKAPVLLHCFNSMFGERNFSALAFIMMLGWFDQKNAGYLIGGSLPLSRRMEEHYRSLGGKINTGKKVIKILVENDSATGILLSDGTIVKGDYVISAADGHATIYDMLGGRYISKEIKNAYETWELFTPLVQVSFGINAVMGSEYPAQSVIARDKKIGSTIVKYGYSIMNYSFDPTMAPTGKTVIVLRFESPWDQWKGLTTEEYKTEKEKVRNDAIAILESHYPGVSEYIEIVDVATPLTNVRYTGVWKGAYEGFMPAPENITKSLKNTLPGLANFYLAGQWLFPGGGIPPSVLSGKQAIKQICKKEKKQFRAA